MIRLGLEHPGKCLWLLALNLLVLGLTLGGLSLVGAAIDLIRHVMADGPEPRLPMGLKLGPDLLAAPFRGVLTISAGILGVAVVRMVVRHLAALAQSRLLNAVMSYLRAAVYDKLQRLSFRFFDANETGSIINRATSDASATATFTEWALIQIFILLVTIVVYFFFMLQLHVSLTLVSMLTVPPLALASVIYSRRVRPGYEENRRRYDRLIRTLSENIQGQHVVKGFTLDEVENRKFQQANDDYREQQRWIFKRSALYSAAVNFLGQVNLIIVLLYGGLLVVEHRQDLSPALTVGNLIIFAALLQQFSNQVAAIANVANTLAASLTAAGRVREILLAPLEIANKPEARRLPKARGDVAFEGVTFSYRADEPVLKEVTFRVNAGQCVAILGATGAGKSTLLSLIPRFFDSQQGRVLVDGVDVRDLHVDDLRRNIGLVFQESFLFSNSIAANIAFGNPGASREQIENAAKIAAAHDFIMELPEGYDTIISEAGTTLSGGQRQRIAIARAMLLEPAILILDDATAAIDSETEHEILQAMDNAMQGRTTFVVAHRLSTLRRADFILVLDHGRIIESGTHEQLMRANGRYREVAAAQVGDAESKLILRARQWMEGAVDSPLIPGEGI